MKYKIYEYSAAALAWIATYFSPAFPLILMIAFFVLCDMVTGIAASKKKNKEAVKSRKLRCTIWKFASYGIAILVAHVIEKQFLPEVPAMKLIAGFVAYIELKSIDENIKIVTGTSFFKVIIEKLGHKNEEK